MPADSPTAAHPAPIVSDSRTVRRAVRDLVDGATAHRELWLELGWQDIKQRYRRSVIGPFWITIATGVTASALALLWSVLLGADVKTLLPQLTVGFVLWNFIQSSIIDGSEVFIANEGLIKQLPAPLSVHVYRLVWRHLLFLAHNMIIVVVVLAIFPPERWSWTQLSVIPAIGMLALTAVWVALFFGILATRFRDISPLLTALTQLLFYVTPVVWTLETVPGGNSERAQLVKLNPLYHYLELVRGPLTGKPFDPQHWYVVIGCTVVGWALTLVLMKQFRSRVAYWV
ncbi:galactan export ABC transporter permease subunit Wzm/RfbD [Tsukamurella serpentis]